MVVPGLPYAFQGRMGAEEVKGGTAPSKSPGLPGLFLFPAATV